MSKLPSNLMESQSMPDLATADFKKCPTLTVVTVVFNGRDEIARTISSVLTQDYPNLEYIVIDGESSDGTSDIIKKYEDKLDLFVCERDEGVYDAMNKAIGRARGEFLIFMNCGDTFASTDAVSAAMKFVQHGLDQVIFGCWMRRVSNESLLHCRPLLEQGFFNHQAVIYSRNIHAWHGNYINVKGLTTADYIFFVTLFDSSAVICKTIDTTLAVIDINGLSSGPQTLSQKYAIDFICGRTSKVRLLSVLAGHPLYLRAKALLRWVR